MAVKTYDVKCFELAKHFLNDTALAPQQMEGYAHDLALDIQQAIEDFLEAEKL